MPTILLCLKKSQGVEHILSKSAIICIGNSGEIKNTLASEPFGTRLLVVRVYNDDAFTH